MVGQALVRQEIVLEALQYPFRQFGYVRILLKHLVTLQNRDYLIVGLVVIDQAQASDRASLENDVAARYVMFAEDQNVQRIAVPASYLSCGFLPRCLGH